MKVAIDLLPAKSQHHGVGVYVTNILKYLIPKAKSYTFLLYKRKKGIPIPNHGSHRNWKWKEINFPTPLRIIWEHSSLPFLLAKEKVNLLWSPCNILPLVKTCRYLVTIHDLAPFLLPLSLPFTRRIYYQQAFFNSIRKADKIIVVSQSLKFDLMKLFSIPEGKIAVIHNGFDENFRPITDKLTLSLIREKYHLPSDFILTLGVLEPKKNTERLLWAYAELKKSLPNLPKLVIGGSRKYGWLNTRLLPMVKNLKLAGEVIFPDTIFHEDLPAVYSLAKVFILPSLYEGFGLPVLEAMACGTPVVTSNISSLPEVAGDAAILVNPYDVSDIARGIKEALLNEKKRQEMIEKGLKNVQRFSWRKAAEEVLEVLEEVLKKG
ncbi:MAG: glycosyltransferase family 1 protein [candidate division WOR-3 bacterium]